MVKNTILGNAQMTSHRRRRLVTQRTGHSRFYCTIKYFHKNYCNGEQVKILTKYEISKKFQTWNQHTIEYQDTQLQK